MRARGLDPELRVFALGAAATAGAAAWVLLDDPDDSNRAADGRGLGAALVWALRGDASSLTVIAGRGSPVIARRAAEFSIPVDVFVVAGTELRPSVAEPAGLEIAADPRHLDLTPVIEAAGAEVVVEHGVVTGEVRGLEICRVVADGNAVRLDVGVGAHDREAFGMIHGDVPTVDALAVVVETVAAHRDIAAPGHPLNRLSAERFLRWRLQRDPGLIGLDEVVPAQPPVPRPNLKDASPATALGRRTDGSPVVVVTSVGVDLDVIPYAADARLANGGIDTWVVTPARDLLAAIRELNSALRRPVELLPLS